MALEQSDSFVESETYIYCYGLNADVRPPRNVYVETLIPRVMLLETEPLRVIRS